MLFAPNGRPVSSRADGMLNVVTGLGDGMRDRSQHTTIVRRRALSSAQLDIIYEQKGLGALVVDLPAAHAVRKGFDVVGADGVDLGDVSSDLEDLKLKTARFDLDRFGSLYGGAVLGLALDDGLDPAMPLDLDRIRKVEGLFVLDRHALYPLRTSHGPPEAYTIRTEVDIPIEERTIHASRLMKFCGVTPTARRFADLDWWGISNVERVWDEMRRIWSAQGYAESILHDISVDVFMIAGLADAFASDNEELVRRRIQSLMFAKSNLRALALDAGNEHTKAAAEQYIPQSRSVAGIHELMDTFWVAWVATTGIPKSIVMGETSGGALESGSNKGDHDNWNSKVAQRRDDLHTPWINFVLEPLFASKEGPTNGSVPDSWEVEHHPLSQPSEKEQAETRKLRWEGDQIAVDTGAASVADVRTTRIENGGVGELEDIEEPEPPPEPMPLMAPPGVGVPPLPEEEEEDADA